VKVVACEHRVNRPAKKGIKEEISGSVLQLLGKLRKMYHGARKEMLKRLKNGSNTEIREALLLLCFSCDGHKLL
jgi:hypothetical protein